MQLNNYRLDEFATHLNPGDTIREVFEVPSVPTLQDDETSRILDVLGWSVATMCVSRSISLDSPSNVS